MKIVGICGSPHPDGNTGKLIKMVLKGAESAGAETEFISLANKKI
ncbi:MAG: flavodoxin family protein, partial [Thermoplasmata archaeon]|nr:flavodoxin family protein [Thermoplasmata archaeon]